MPDSLSLDDSVATALSLITANDAMDAAAVASSFEPDGILRFANGRESQGIERIQKTLTSFFDSLGSLSHEVIGVTTGAWSGGHVVSVEAEVTYVRPDGSTVGPLPVTSTLRLTPHGTVARYQIYIDATPLSTPAESTKVTVEESR
jgi:hypothetical protein